MSSGGAYKEQIVKRLRYLIELKGKSVTGIEKELGRGRGYLGDALRGGKRLPLEMLVDVLEILEVPPESFFAGRTDEELQWASGGDRDGPPGAAVYRRPRAGAGEVAESEGGEGRLEALLEVVQGKDDPQVRDLARLIQIVLGLLERKGFVTKQELQAAFRGERRGRETSGS